ncbi:MAG: RICIN domain-containing protein, partial [Gammaproteobacteria bacterium]|nr:RICIN domain-containing protein [Gammaproteobacteria bacterium]
MSKHPLTLAAALLTLSTASHANSVEDFRNSWTHAALAHQRTLQVGEPLGETSFQKTHNSYNASAYANLGSYWDPNQTHSLVDQLDMGIRALELDVHYTQGTWGKDLLLCHGTGSHAGCSIFDRRFEDGLKEVASWLRQARNRQEVIILYLEEHVDGEYDRTVDALERQLGDLIYKPQGCSTLPMDISRADILNAGKQVLLIGGNCSHARWASTVFNYGYPTQNGSFQGYPACRTANYDTAYLQRHLVRIYEDSTRLSNLFGDPPQPITPALMAEAMRCNLGVVGLDFAVPFDPRLEAAVWSWDRNEPNNWNSSEHCAEQWGNGRFNDASCGTARPFACQNPTTREWRITLQQAAWRDGEQACRNEFGSTFRFEVPRNGYQNQKLVDAKAAAGVTHVWLNYTDLAEEGQWTPGNATAITPPGQPDQVVWRKLRNDHGRCLDLEGRNTANGTEIHQWSCHGADSQLWWQDSYGRLRNKSAPDKCADVSGAGTGKGTRVVLWSCHGGANQLWVRGTSNSFRPGHAPNMALDIKDPIWGNGQRAHLWEFHGGKS